jgi:hypothetical protein
VPIVNDFHSIVDGSVYHLQVGDDSDAEVYKAIGQTMTLRELCEAMITVSSNLAANLLIERLGVENIRATVARLGATGMNVRRGVEDQKAFDQGVNNTTTARGLAVLLQKLAKARRSTPAPTPRWWRSSSGRSSTTGFRAGVPEGTPVAHKTGSITKINPRRGDRLRTAPVRAGHPRARHPGPEKQRGADRGDIERGLDCASKVADARALHCQTTARRSSGNVRREARFSCECERRARRLSARCRHRHLRLAMRSPSRLQTDALARAASSPCL